MADFEILSFWHCKTADEFQVPVGKYLVKYGKTSHQNKDVQFDWSCTCGSYVYQKGTDQNGYCKHIRAAKTDHCGWMQFIDGGDATPEGKCPRCGGPVISMRWAV